VKNYNSFFFFFLLSGENMVSKPSVQMQAAGKGKSDGRAKPT
jgi:hypothetical protein